MTIKVILAQTEQERPTTHLFEGEKVSYKSVHFKNREEFEGKYNEIIGHLGSSSILGIPDNYWDQKIGLKTGYKDIEPNIFFCVYYGKENELEKCLILQNAIVYIVNQGGQTVDKIHC